MRVSGLQTEPTSTILGTIDLESKPRANGAFGARWSKPLSRRPMCGHSPKPWASQIGISRQPPASLQEFLAALQLQLEVSVAWNRLKTFYRLRGFAMCACESTESWHE